MNYLYLITLVLFTAACSHVDKKRWPAADGDVPSDAVFADGPGDEEQDGEEEAVTPTSQMPKGTTSYPEGDLDKGDTIKLKPKVSAVLTHDIINPKRLVFHIGKCTLNRNGRGIDDYKIGASETLTFVKYRKVGEYKKVAVFKSSTGPFFTLDCPTDDDDNHSVKNIMEHLDDAFEFKRTEQEVHSRETNGEKN